jgi:hypothetical protein
MPVAADWLHLLCFEYLFILQLLMWYFGRFEFVRVIFVQQ